MLGLEHDERLDDFRAHRIGLADRRGKRHRGMADQTILDFAGADAVAGRDDHVVVSPLKVKPAVLVFCDEVARVPDATVAAAQDRFSLVVRYLARSWGDISISPKKKIEKSQRPSFLRTTHCLEMGR